jgi:hypothetical protein
MDLCSDMVSYETHDPLAAGSRQALAGISQASRKPVDPKSITSFPYIAKSF